VGANDYNNREDESVNESDDAYSDGLEAQYNPENPEGILAFGVWHKITRLDDQIVLLEIPMVHYRGGEVEEDEDETSVLELDELPASWVAAAMIQGEDLEEGEERYFQYPDEGAAADNEDEE